MGRLVAFLVALVAFFPSLAFAQAANCPIINVAPILDSAKALMNLVNLTSFIVIAVGAICLLILIARFAEILKYIPKEFWEFLGYAVGVGLTASPYWAPALQSTWVSVLGAVIIGGMIQITGTIHNLKSNKSAYFVTLLMLYGGLALWYQSEAIGFLAVMALMALLGFTVIGDYLGVAIGFEKEDHVPGATIAAIAILAGTMTLQHSGVDLGPLHVFELGAIWMGSIVASIGLLILASVWYGYGEKDRRPTYILMQIAVIGAYFAGIYFGAVYGNDVVMYFSVSLFALYVFLKPHEIRDADILWHAFAGLVMSIILGAGLWWVQEHKETVLALINSARAH